jgi:integrase
LEKVPPKTQISLLTKSALRDRNIMLSSFLTAKYQGKIINLDLKVGQLDKYGAYSYKLKFELKGNKDTETTIFYYPEEELRILKAVKLVNGKEEPININNLQIGDFIAIKTVFDIKRDRLIESKITKL